MLLRAQPQPTGAPAAPAWRVLWARAFDSSDASGDLATLRAPPAHGESIDAAWLVETLLQGDLRSRSERLDQFAFGQRALALTGPADLSDALFVLRSLPRFRMLMLTLERIGVHRPALYAALTRLAEQISDLETTRARAALANFQGAIALVERLVRVRSIDSSTAERLLEALALVPFKEERGFLGGLAPWLQFDLRHALRRDGGFEEILVEALAGSADEASIEPVSWEGQQYWLDIAATERQRLRRAGAREAGHAIDLAVTLHGLAQRLATDPAASNEIQSTLVELNQPAALSSDSRRALESLLSLVDVVVGDALLALNYEVNLNLARGTPLAAAAVAARHDFGLEMTNDDARVRAAWAMPKRIVKPSVPWHLAGAALGLEVAAPFLALRRIDTASPPRSPVLDGTEGVTFAMSVALMDPRAMRNDDLDAIAGAIARGRHRVDALAAGDGDVNAVAREIAMDGWRVRALRWSLRHEPQRARSWFSMTELLYLGGGRGTDLHAWGMSSIDVTGCICARLTAPSLWTALVGRPEPRLLIATVADLNLHVAVALSEMRMPAALAKPVLAIAVRDFVDRAPSLHLDDWLTRVRAAQGLSYRADRGLRLRGRGRGSAGTRRHPGTVSSAMTSRSFVAFVVAFAAGFSAKGAGAADQVAPPLASSPQVRIVSPANGAYVVGPTRLRAAVEPSEGLATSVVFFVDGLKVCTLAAPPFECEWDAGQLITQHLLRVVVNLAGGGRVVKTARTTAVEFAETVDVDVVKVTVTVTDDRNRYVKGLPRSAFRVSEDGRAQTISHFFDEDAPLELVVAVDMSESMRPAMSNLKKAVSDFLGAVPSRHGVTLLGFNDDVFTLAQRAADPAARVKAVDTLTPWGTTALYDVILKGADLLDSQTGRKALIVFTDGEDAGSNATIADVEARLQTSDLTLYMIGQGQGIMSAPLKKVMERLSRPTGGRAFFTERAEELQSLFNELLEELSQHKDWVISRQTARATKRGARSRSMSMASAGFAPGRATARLRHRANARGASRGLKATLDVQL